MDARDRLRQYFEQRRELGEREFVLDGLPLEEALRLIGLRGDASRSADHPTETSAARDVADRAGADGDWRAALRSIGAQKPGSEQPSSGPVAKAPAPRAPAATGAPAKDPPHAGIAIGHALGGVKSDAALGALDSLDAVAKAVRSCTLCSLHATAKNAVPGEGNPHAGFVCVGEAPGATEDETGRPFVGRAGELLTKILIAVNLAREDVFICNVLKHRPPGNRNPTDPEIKACSPYLLRQLELLQPRVILALGTFAAQTLLQTTQSIGKLRGQVHRYYGVPLIVTYHPAALLRNPSWKRPTWEDVQLARRIFDNAAAGA